uniref:Uncharacterized protein n=1 Tax=Arion vulgaris TaxID=1028688 RepID=A0A0B7BKV8_9EUPU
MAERKRLSGAQYRKRRAENEKDVTKQGDSLLKYLCTPHRDEGSPEELNNQAEADKEAKESDEMTVSEEFEPQNEMHVLLHIVTFYVKYASHHCPNTHVLAVVLKHVHYHV